ncbi:hypothetical protein HWV62_35252 [Athelia sp. TMB]|nr:hypothetical protein HWV62_35252 [Athelia sp. TMB]
MAVNLLPIRILFHVTFVIVYLPVIIFNFEAGGVVFGAESLSALIGLGIFAALDIFSVRNKVNQSAFLAIDIFVGICLPGCVWSVIALSGIWIHNHLSAYWMRGESNNYSIGYATDSFLWAFAFSAGLTVLVLSTVFVLYFIVAALMDKILGRPFWPIYPADSPLSPSERGKWHFLGPRRTPSERAAVVNHLSGFLFQRSVFRKHAFEPTGWAILRGVVAVYACVGLVVFSAYSGVSEAQTATSGSLVETNTPLSIVQEAPPNALSVTMVNISFASQDFRADNRSARPLNQTIVSDDVQVWSNLQYAEPAYPFKTPDPGFNVSWTGPYSMALWATAAETLAFPNSSQIFYSPALPLAPFKIYTIYLTIVSYKTDSLSWLFLQPEVQSAVDSGSNSSLATFSFVPYQQVATTLDMSSSSTFITVAHVLSDIGGTYAFLDGLFALIFGRTMVAILFGTRIISPFGLLGILARQRFRHLINLQFPRLQDDIDRGGMAAYISEVAIDAALVNTPEAVRITRVASSDSGGDAGEYDRNAVGLRPMDSDPSKNGSGSANLGLPYEIEALELAGKYA